MKFHVKARNYMGYGHEGLEVDFSTSGITGIQGVNKSSRSKTGNGTGKSMISGALIYGLYGIPPGVLKKQLVNLDVGKDSEVEVTIDRGDKVGIVTRRIACEGYNDGTWFEIDGADRRGGTEAQTQKNIIDFVGLDRNSLVSAILFSAGEGKTYAGETPANQDKILTELLSLEDYDTAKTNARKEREKAKKEIQQLDTTVMAKQSTIQEMKRQQEEFTQMLESWKENQAQKKKNTFAEIENTKLEIQSLTKKDSDTIKLLDKLETSIKELPVKETLEKVKLIFERELEEVQEALRKWSQEEGKILSRGEDVEDKMALARSLDGQASCPACGSDLTGDSLTEYMISLQNKREKIEQDLKTHKKSRGVVENNLATVKSKIAKTSEDLQGHRSYAVQQQQLENTGDYIEKQVGHATEALKSLKIDLAKLEEELPPTTEATKNLESLLKTKQEEIENILVDKAKLEPLLDIYAFWEWGFSSQGIKNYIIESMLPELNQLAQRYSGILTEGELSVEFSSQSTTQKGEARNRLSVKIDDLFGSDSYITSSGGERRRIDLIVTLALNSLVALRRKIGFVVVDEALVKLDEAGKENVIKLLREMEKSIPSIFVISNQADILAHGFDRIWTVVREKRESRLIKGVYNE